MPPQLKVIETRNSSGVTVGQVFDLVKDRIVFGRSSENDISFAFDRVREHGLLLKVGDDYYIEDISDKRRNPLLVNNAPILGQKLLKDGDVVSVFGVRFEYRKEKGRNMEA